MRLGATGIATLLLALAAHGCSDSNDGEEPDPLAAGLDAGRDARRNEGGTPGDTTTDGGTEPGDEAGADAALPPPVPYANPVLAGDFPDPAVIRAKNRKFYAFATGGTIQRAESTDLVHWTRIGNAMPAKPTWASNKGNFWAPHIVEHDGTSYLYFSAEQNAGTGSFCIGVATSTGPDQPFVDVGQPIVCGASFVNIDPMTYDDPQTGKRLLYWGSGFAPIRVQELAANRTSLAPGSAPTNLIVTSAAPYERLVEAAWVHEHGGFFYMFYSGDDCCGNANAPPHYAVLLARAKSPTGPFEDFTKTGAPNNTMLVANARWIGPGHNAVVVDDAGEDWMVYHAFDAQNNSGRNMLIDRITYVNGWPTIAGRTPSQGMQTGPVFRP
jgi:arabinan endo-1,5-alpha-L-arabinosidase